jgi:hypothetical protein
VLFGNRVEEIAEPLQLLLGEPKVIETLIVGSLAHTC